MDSALKKVFLVVLAGFLFYQAIYLISIYVDLPIRSLPLIIFSGWIINMLITGVFAFSGFALPTQKLLPEEYYRVKRPSSLKRVYKMWKVELFRKFLLLTFWREKKQRDKYFNGRADGIANLILQSKKSEFGHLIPFVILCGVGLYFLVRSHVVLGGSILFFNVLGNWYPIILQRYHRMRIDKIRKRFPERMEKSASA